MRQAPFREEKSYDAYLEKTMLDIRDHIEQKNDDYHIVITGDPGTGKSTLSLHISEIVLPPELLNINIAAMSKSDFAESLKYCTHAPKPRLLWYDEANVQKRDALSRWNKELIDLYFAIRGLNIFHIWCNPSIEVLDRPFIEERLKAIIYVKGKGKEYRRYYFFRKKDILNIYAKYGKLDLNLLSRVRGKYSYFEGWFKDYDGVLKKPYLEKKEARMKAKVDQFFKNHGGNELSSADLAKKVGISKDAVTYHVRTGKFKEGEHYEVTPSGFYRFKPEAISVLQENLKRLHPRGEISGPETSS